MKKLIFFAALVCLVFFIGCTFPGGSGNISGTATVSLSSPADEYSDSFLPVLSWQGNYNLFNLQISGDSDFSSLIYDNDYLSETSFLLDDVNLDTGTYYWRVRARANILTGWSNWTASRSFTITSFAITNPSPVNNGSSAVINPVISWTSDASIFDIEISTNEYFASIFESSDELSVSSFTCTESYSNGESYYWRVRSVDSNGLRSRWSSTYQFSISLSGTVLTSLVSPGIDEEFFGGDFSSAVTTYNITLPLNEKTLLVSPTLSDSRASWEVLKNDVSQGTSGPLSIDVTDGDVVKITVTDPIGSASATTYTFTVALSHSTDLQTLTPNAGSLSPAFSASSLNYTLTVPNGTSSIDFDVPALEDDASVVIKKSGSDVALPTAISDGNVLTFIVSDGAPVAKTKTYTVTVVEAAAGSIDTTLSSISVKNGDPLNFVSGTTTYTLTMPLNVTTELLTAVPTEAGAVVQVMLDGVDVTNQAAVSTVDDDSVYTITVSAAGSTSTVYTVNVGLTHSALLNSLTADSGALNPGFTAGRNAYTLTMAAGSTEVSLTPVTSETAATVSVSYADAGGNTTVSTWPHTISDGGIFTITVTDGLAGGGGTTNAYSVTVDVGEAVVNDDDLLITEISANYYSYMLEWIEIYNPSATSLDLAEYSIKIPDASNSATERIFTLTDASLDESGSRWVEPGEYVILRAYPGGDDKAGKYNIFIENGSGALFKWAQNGYVELLKSGATKDFIRFGSSTQFPVTTGQWDSNAAPALTARDNYFGNSLSRDFSNTDTNTSADWTYVDWASPGGPNDILGLVDADVDGIPDANEVAGATYLGLPLYEWGARPGVVDYFVHIDYMHDSTGQDRGPGIYPRPEALLKIQQAFINQTASDFEYRVHFDVGDTSAYAAKFADGINAFNLDNEDHSFEYANSITLTQDPAAEVDFYQIKADKLKTAKRQIFHYLIMGSVNSTGGSGIAEVNGNDIQITISQSTNPFISDRYRIYLYNLQSLAIMHELGHNLGLLHGGNERENYKPNYVSIMNYMYSAGKGLPTIGHEFEGDRYYYYYHKKIDGGNQSIGFAAEYYANEFYVNDFHNSPYSEDFIIDYSDGSSEDINEGAVLESAGLGRTGSAGVDYNGNGTIENTTYVRNLNSYDTTGGDAILTDWNDWDSLYSVFRRANVGKFLMAVTETPDPVDPNINDIQTITVDYFEDFEFEAE